MKKERKDVVENVSTLKEKINDFEWENIRVLENHSIEKITAKVLKKHVKDLERNSTKLQELLKIEYEMVTCAENSIFDEELE